MIYTLGESLVDVIVGDVDKATLKAGGGMLNTAVSLSRSGKHAHLISEVGDDQTAAFILKFLKSNKVGTRFIKKYYRQSTSVAVAFLDDDKKPAFSIHKSYPDKRNLVGPTSFSKDDILIYGSLYSLDAAIRSQLLPILIQAKNEGAVLIYDPNIRRHKIDTEELKASLFENLSLANIVKASDEDMMNVYGSADGAYCFEEIKKANPKTLFILTKGGGGAEGFYQDIRTSVPATPVQLVSTIGAGDAFNAGLAYYQSEHAAEELRSKDALIKMLETGTVFAAEVCGSIENYVRPVFRPS